MKSVFAGLGNERLWQNKKPPLPVGEFCECPPKTTDLQEHEVGAMTAVVEKPSPAGEMDEESKFLEARGKLSHRAKTISSSASCLGTFPAGVSFWFAVAWGLCGRVRYSKRCAVGADLAETLVCSRYKMLSKIIR